MKELDALTRELDLWAEAGKTADFWWRDDDAEEPTDAIRRLLDQASEADVPLILATIPKGAGDALAQLVEQHPVIVPVQHGWAHQDHAPQALKGKWELGYHRPMSAILDQLMNGRKKLETLFGDRFQPMMVPPWNRIDPAVINRLAGIGLTTLSTSDARPGPMAAPGLAQVNCHCDIIKWKNVRAFVGPEKMAIKLVSHLIARRTGEADPAEPTGLLTHAWIHDDPAWQALAAAARLINDHPAACWVNPMENKPQ